MDAAPGGRTLVLLVEDDRAGRELFALGFTDAGFRVEQAHNGLQALDKAFDMRPDVIVTDRPGSYAAAIKEINDIARVTHEPVRVDAHKDNIVEQSHRPTRDQEKLSVGFGIHGEHKLFWLGTRLSQMLSNELDEGYRQASGGRIPRKRLGG